MAEGVSYSIIIANLLVPTDREEVDSTNSIWNAVKKGGKSNE